jgi:hypothetical protein
MSKGEAGGKDVTLSPDAQALARDLVLTDGKVSLKPNALAKWKKAHDRLKGDEKRARGAELLALALRLGRGGVSLDDDGMLKLLLLVGDLLGPQAAVPKASGSWGAAKNR